jgi:hypothetical protein
MDDAAGRLAARARAQHGTFTRGDVERCGLTDWALRRLVVTGWCEPVAEGVFRVAAAPRSTEQRWALALATQPAASALSHETAGEVYGLPGVRSRVPIVSVERGRSHRNPLAIVRTTLWLPSAHIVVRRNLPMTTVARTLFDLAGVLPFPAFEVALDGALSRRLCTVGQLERVHFVLARRGRRGTAAVRRAVEARGKGFVAPASELERVGRRVFAEGGLPPPRFEVDLGGERWVGRVDCVWSEAKLVVELDSRRHHEALLARDADRRRDNDLMAQGWRVLRFTWDDLHRRPAEVLAQIRAALAAV